MRRKTFLLLGAPGSGKGTQGKILGTIPRFFHLACGDVFRSLDLRTDVGKAFMEYSSKGQLVPDNITIELWENYIDNMIALGRYKPEMDYLVLDGIPRNVRQAEIMDEFVVVEKVFHLSCPNRETLMRRMRKRALKDNRLDDAKDEVIRERFAQYEAETKPLLEYFGKPNIVEIDATAQPYQVLRTILNNIKAD
ncbi:MAG: nucleoside monophosphate kinase [Verrucomicrobiales bacterium]|nr:nucleoside monophosphate kinase [Verrucomicrobiales bacterium]